ncbi:unnamed protein product [Echinostoma caproni]|uniref:Uncharacterized protein n=1 Tax=Echinostoma caproni TaxID=27848 RepID=A0A183B1D2_9TREM|nr:unnamed protein product [Echinostoma caproni]
MSGTPKYPFKGTQCYERIDHRHVELMELFFLFTRVFLFECWRTTPIWKDLEKLCGSVLGPLLFVVYVKDLSGQLCSPSLMYADVIKIWRAIYGADDRKTLQVDLNNLDQWADT